MTEIMINNTPELCDIRDAVFNSIYEIAQYDPDVILLTADMGAMGLGKFKKDFSHQFFNVGIAEQNMLNVAAGLALGRKKVFVYGIAPFVTMRCYEQIKAAICDMKLNVHIIGAGAGFTYGSDGPTHHAIHDIACMRILPGMTVFSPSDAETAAASIKYAYDQQGPTYIRLDKGLLPNLLNELDWDVKEGARQIQHGSDVSIFSTGIMSHTAVKVAKKLRNYNVSARVIDVFRLSPLNKEMILDLIQGVHYMITLEEHVYDGGMGSIITELVSDAGCEIRLKRIALANGTSSLYGDRNWLHKRYNIDADTVLNTILSFIESGYKVNI